MIIYTNKALFKPLLILMSILFVPSIIALFISTILLKEISIIVILTCFVFTYIFVIFLIRWDSNKKDNYLKIDEDILIINFPNIAKNDKPFSININLVIKIDYYKITSFVSWFVLPVVSLQVPKVLFISYKKNDKVITEAIGHAELKEIKKLCEDNNIKLIIH